MKKFSISKWIVALGIGAMVATGLSTPVTSKAAYPGAWEQTAEGWKYKKHDSSGDTWYVEGGFVRTGGNKYYFNEDGIMQTGWIQRGNSWYYADSTGALLKGWQTIGGTMYYFYPDYRMAADTVIDRRWVIDENGAYVGSAGAWKQDATGWWYQKYDGTYYKDETAFIGDDYYAFNEDGYLIIGWVEVVYENGNTSDWMYSDADGRLVTGWRQINGAWYYFYSDGLMATDTTIDGVYEIGSDGALTGRQGQWKKDSTGWWFTYPDGTYAKSCRDYIDDELYFFNENGYMMTGWIDYYKAIGYDTESTSWYYVYADGSKPDIGWQVIDGAWYYFPYTNGRIAQNESYAGYIFDANGNYTALTEEQKESGTWKSDSKGWWYENEDGSFRSDGWTYIDGVRYAFDNDGYMLTGWVNDADYYDATSTQPLWYYFEADGKGAMGWKQLGGKWYFFDEGYMYHDTYVDGCYLGHDGAWTDDLANVNYYY